MKNPKQKAEELVEKFHYSCRECDSDWNAKQCAFTCCEEIIKVTTEDPYNRHNKKDIKTMSTMDKQYWLDVLDEIKKL